MDTPFGPESSPAFTYTVRLDHTDGTFSVVDVDADSIDKALAYAFTPDTEQATVLGAIDRAPQVALIF